MSASPLLKVDHLSVNYGAIRAVTNVTLELAEGQIGCLLGANGAGKSTTLLAISGILTPEKGTVFFNGHNITGKPPEQIVRLGISQAPEGRHIFPQMTVRENILIGAYTRQDSFQGDIQHVLELFPRLKERYRQLAGTLSGGEQQMLAIARALMAKPKLLILDEPSLGLAPLIAKQIFGIIRTIADEGVTVLLVEQNATAALQLSDVAVVLETGRVALSGNAKTLAKDPRLKAAYLGS